MKQSIFKLLLLSAPLLGATSCDDFLAQYSQDLVVAKSVSDLNELLVGDVYLRSYTVDNGMNGGTYAFVNCLDDDINMARPKEGETSNGAHNTAWRNVTSQLFGYFAWQQDVRYNFGGTNKQEDNTTWNTLYQRIAHANNIIDIIDEMPHATNDEATLYHRVKGEAHFVRAHFYWMLANLYGKPFRPDSAATDLCVPLKLTPHVSHLKERDTQFDRATVAEVYDQVIADLLVARDQLTISPQPARFRLHRASLEATQLLLSRVYLYKQDWAAAEAAAAAVMQSPNFTLASISQFGARSPFLTQGNSEIIFSQGANHIAPKNTTTSLTGDPGDYCVSRELYDLYPEEDVRKANFFAVNANSDSIRLTYKYERGLELNHISDALALRVAEAYLNHAEACAMQGKSADANASLAALRAQRIMGYAHTALSGRPLVDDIRLERRRELCFEGHRWFDLRRYAVNAQYPFGKTIRHTFNSFDDNAYFVASHTFELPAGDPAYTFAIPPKALEFDKVPMPNNLRPKREELRESRPLFPPAPVSPAPARGWSGLPF